VVDSSTPLGLSGTHSQLPFDPPLAAPAPELHEVGPVIGMALDTFPEIGSDHAIDGVAMSTFNPISGQAHLMYVSENLANLVGRPPADLLGRSPELLLSPRTPMQQLSAVAAVVESGQQAIVNLWLQHAEGHEVPVRASFLLVPSLPRQAPHFLALYRCLTPPAVEAARLSDQSDILDSLARGNELDEVIRQVADRISDQIPQAECWVGLADRAGTFELALAGKQPPETVLNVCRYLTESGPISTPRCVRFDDFPSPLSDELKQSGVHAVWSYPFAGSDRALKGLLIVAQGERSEPDPDENQMLVQLSRVVAVAVDRNAAEATLAHQALHDALTQLPNRALILDRLEQAVARLGRDKSCLAALLVDLNRFKALNDSRGAEVGDQVLLEVSRRLRGSVRLGDTVGRIGGDQFLVLCVAVNGEADAVAMAERIVSGLAEPIVLPDGDQLGVTASVGVVLIDRPGLSPSTIISNAESALGKAAETGGGSFALYEEAWQQKTVIRHEVEQALHVAISEEELLLHYQPIVEIATGRMVGSEALIRWDRPGHGVLPPADFIEIAEETGLIVPVGDWVIDEVCRQLAAWPVGPIGVAPFISVNLSARQLAEESLVSTVLAAMDRHGTRAKQLAFEVTESMRVEDIQTASVSLRKLAALGCKVAIDDFGIGYATLDYLRRFSMADTIKIDRSFVNGLGASREDTAIVTASIALASSLGLSVVAEGVETEAQYDALAELRCKFAQGYVLSPPVALEEAHHLWFVSRLIHR